MKLKYIYNIYTILFLSDISTPWGISCDLKKRIIYMNVVYFIVEN